LWDEKFSNLSFISLENFHFSGSLSKKLIFLVENKGEIMKLLKIMKRRQKEAKVKKAEKSPSWEQYINDVTIFENCKY
jgi:hypothetical protein